MHMHVKLACLGQATFRIVKVSKLSKASELKETSIDELWLIELSPNSISLPVFAISVEGGYRSRLQIGKNMSEHGTSSIICAVGSLCAISPLIWVIFIPEQWRNHVANIRLLNKLYVGVIIIEKVSLAILLLGPKNFIFSTREDENWIVCKVRRIVDVSLWIILIGFCNAFRCKVF